ncbi:MAG: FAD-binding oxidoreductase [Nitrosomonadales bacterium]|nr:FAD-binding oxidoreductase [Nitrosomonadales bacterium]
MSPDLIHALYAIVGTENVLAGAATAPHCNDKRGRYSGNALAVVLPADTAQVSAVVALCAAQGIAIVPQGGNTSLCGASVPLAEGGQIVLNLSRMNRIRELDATNYTITVEAGCILADVREAAEQGNRLFPLCLPAERHCEIGGNLSTNAGGINVLRYGNMRDLVLGLEVVLPDGRVWNGLRALRKDNSGYDLKHLFIGAEGTLGVITAATLKLFPRPQAMASACVGLRDPAAAVALFAHLRAACGDRISAFEFLGRTCLDLVLRHIPDAREPFSSKHEWLAVIDLSDVLDVPLDKALRAALESFPGGIEDFAVSAEKAQAESWWKLRYGISDAQKMDGISIKHDISVPVSRVAEFLAQADAALHDAFPGVRIAAFGHIGDGNIHYNASMPDPVRNKEFIKQHEHDVNRIVYEVVAKFGGSISAEHGVGQLKREEITRYKSALELEMMRSIKQVFDPRGLMNPGKVI